MERAVVDYVVLSIPIDNVSTLSWMASWKALKMSADLTTRPAEPADLVDG